MRVYRTIPARADLPLALTIGNFDGVHLGHRAMLDRLKREAAARELPAAVMTFEPHPREFFAPDQAPTRLSSLREKLEMLAALGVDRTYVCRFTYDFARTPAEEFVARVLVQGLGVRWLLVGDDFRFGARRAGDMQLLSALSQRHGYEVHSMASVVADGRRVSSTAVREALSDGDLELAAQLLGRPYLISGRVVRGDRIGRTLGFPTANVRMRHNRPPLYGIFAVRVHGLGPRPVNGAASLGVRPTVDTRGVPVLEVHLLDFERDIYGRHVQVEFLHKLRDEQKYPDLESLRKQIAVDVAQIRRFFSREDLPLQASNAANSA
ncbi:MAG: bifunctional riboflavin kinase/FAD synthetase [Betaproteobacteria bacterium]|nr:MAG: bifunctional riboflavin kinase/FAD synthetase [Betaproteobacteria bacterium]